ncbi:hypothetical protein [Bradyrhizobium sp. ARR65]|uniref:hypothetical protein n=1 Tax=Bradyrhizobium sp. ARR65 TaxID=1040989 RepID=UPI0004668612|nr:hypothetical protein [Bradyrhizobium sp. ARR65]
MNDANEKCPSQSELDGLCLGEIQRYRLRQLVRRHRGTVMWDGSSAIEAPDLAVVVLNAENPARIEMLVGSLHENSIIIVPFGENPAFDFLKSKLHAYGSIGSQGKTAPHHVWWGGVKPLSVPTGLYPRQDTLFLSSFLRTFPFEDRPQRLAADFTRLGLQSVIEGVDVAAPSSPTFKIDFIIRQWERANRPIFWIAPNATVCRHPVLPQAIACDFAVYKSRTGQMETGVLFFHQTEPARSLLDTWQRLSRDYPDVPEAFLLDQAWTLLSSQRQIETAWLPDDYWQAADSAKGRPAVIQYNRAEPSVAPDPSIASRFQRARRYGRHQAPESHLIMQGSSQTGRAITVLIRDVLAGDAENVSGAIEAAARAFAADPGGFSRMEVVLCAWDEDVDSVMQIADDSWVLLTDPSERLQLNAFSKLPISEDRIGAAAHPIYSATAAAHSTQIFRLADASLGAKLKRSGKYSRSLLKRPLLEARGE